MPRGRSATRPVPDATAKSPSDPTQKIMHSQISRAGISLLMASDGTPGGTWKASNNFSVSVECESIDEIERLFATLGEKATSVVLSMTCHGARASACSPISLVCSGSSTVRSLNKGGASDGLKKIGSPQRSEAALLFTYMPYLLKVSTLDDPVD